MRPRETCVVARGHGSLAFSLVDLLVILATVAILAVTLLPALARTHVQTQGTQCLNNLGGITVGWWIYVNENEGKLVGNRGLLPCNLDYEAYPDWVAGNMRNNSAIGPPYTGTDATNSALLVNPTYSQLAPYVTDPVLYRCPTDQSTWSTTGNPGYNETPRVRSYSMSQAIGPQPNGALVDTINGLQHISGHWLSSGNAEAPGGYPWRVYIKESDLVTPTPSQLWLMLDEHPNSINDAAFAFEMPITPADTYFVDVPAAYHNNACNFSFADGHVETHRWQDPAVIPPVTWAADTVPGIGGTGVIYGKDPDVQWMAGHTTAPAPGALGLYDP